LEPTIAVIVVNWNDTTRSLACLRSVIETRHPALIPVLVDNGSSDDPSTALHRALPGVRVLRLDHNGGYAAGCNAGARLAISEGAEYLLFLNNDTTVDASTLPALLAAARQHPWAILGPKIVYQNRPDRVWSAGGSVERPWMVNRHMGEGEPAASHWVERRVAWTSGCAIFVSASLYLSIGRLDEEYFLYLEDLDWCLRAERLGIDTWFIPTAVVRHEVSQTTARLPPAHVWYYGCRNTYFLVFRFSSWRLKPRLLVSLLFTVAKIGVRWALFPGYRRDPWYRARTFAVLDFTRGRRGPAAFFSPLKGEPQVTAPAASPREATTQ
jgi:GT2 family glycosyltransferase